MSHHLSVRINKKADIKKKLSQLITASERYDWSSARIAVRDLDDSLTQHFITRGESPEMFYEYLRKIRYYLNNGISSRFKKKFVLKYAKNLIREFSIFRPGTGAIEVLRMTYDELKEDWMSFWEEPDEARLVAIFDDLESLEMLEERMKGESSEVYKQYRRILEISGECYTDWPVLHALLSGKTGRKEQRQRVFGSFRSLFSEIASLLAPSEYVFVEEEEAALSKVGTTAV